MLQNWLLDAILRSFKACLLVRWAVTTTSSTTTPPSRPTTLRNESSEQPLVHLTNVLIVGAGVSGFSAAQTLQQKFPSGWNITVVESRNNVGGRVESFSFRNYTLQRGANWIFNDTSVGQLFWEAGLKACPDDYLNATVYELDCHGDNRRALRHLAHHSHGLPPVSTTSCTAQLAPLSKVQERIHKFKQEVIPCINKDTKGMWDDDVVDDDFQDIGLHKEYEKCGAHQGKPLDLARL